MLTTSDLQLDLASLSLGGNDFLFVVAHKVAVATIVIALARALNVRAPTAIYNTNTRTIVKTPRLRC